MKVKFNNIGKTSGGNAAANGVLIDDEGKEIPNSYVNIQGPRAALAEVVPLDTDTFYPLTVGPNPAP